MTFPDLANSPRRRSPVLASLFLLLLGLLPLAALAEDGITMKITVSTKGGDGTSVTSYYSDKKARSSEPRSDTIIDYETGSWTVIEHKKKKYWTTTAEETSAFYDKMNSDMGDNPILARMIGDVGNVTSEKTGKTRTIAGYECEEWVIQAGEKYRIEAWVTPEVSMPLTYRDVRRVTTAMMGPMSGPFEAMWKAIADLPGMPLATATRVKVMGMKIDATSEATEVTLGPVPADAFDIPAKYKQKKSPFAN